LARSQIHRFSLAKTAISPQRSEREFPASSARLGLRHTTFVFFDLPVNVADLDIALRVNVGVLPTPLSDGVRAVQQAPAFFFSCVFGFCLRVDGAKDWALLRHNG